MVAAERPLVTARRHQLSLFVPAELASFEAKTSRLEQILTNLLINTAKFTEPGGRIWLAVEPSTDTVVLRVRDNGIGIPREMLARVFDAGRRSSAPPSHSRDGLGTGLALVKALVELHHGTVTTYSGGPGTGAEFVVRPPHRPPLPPTMVTRPSDSLSTARPR